MRIEERLDEKIEEYEEKAETFENRVDGGLREEVYRRILGELRYVRDGNED